MYPLEPRAQAFSAMTPLETIDLGMSFYRILKETPIASAVVLITVETGTDTEPQSIAQGEPAIKGATVSQRITNPRPGNVYRLSFQATTGNGQIFEEVAYLPVKEGDLP